MASKAQVAKGKVMVTARVSAADMEELDRLGREAKPVPASRSEMIGVAIREYVQNHGAKRK